MNIFNNAGGSLLGYEMFLTAQRADGECNATGGN